VIARRAVAVGMLAAALSVALGGCATTSHKYDWGKYDPSLYSYYKDPTKTGELAASLSAVIQAADSKRAVVPPGIYAEYGYLQMQQGKNQEAVDLFRQEEAHWPESKVFMDRMIKVASMPASATTSPPP
jgi:hypothetical protein